MLQMSKKNDFSGCPFLGSFSFKRGCSLRGLRDPTVGGDRGQDPGPKDGKTSSGREYMTRKQHEDAHFCAFVAHNTESYGHDKGKWVKQHPVKERSLREFEIPR